jgi:hypothetical protein
MARSKGFLYIEMEVNISDIEERTAEMGSFLKQLFYWIFLCKLSRKNSVINVSSYLIALQ